MGEEGHAFVGSEDQGQVEGFEPAFGGEVGAGDGRDQGAGLVVDRCSTVLPAGAVVIAKKASESCVPLPRSPT